MKKPVFVNFALTMNCNLKCGFCYAHCDKKETYNQKLSLEKISDIFIQMDELEILRIGFEGGEPFCRKDSIDIFKLVDKHNFTYFVNTNGTLIDEKMACELSKTNILKLCVSIDGPTPEVHDKSIGINGAFVNCIKGIKALQLYDINRNGVIPLTKINKNNIIETIVFLNENGINSIAIMLLPTVGFAHESEKDYYLDYEDLKHLIYELSKFKKNNPTISISIVPPGEGFIKREIYFPLKDLDKEEYVSLWQNEDAYSTLAEEDYGYTAGKDNMYITANGDVKVVA